MLANAITEDHAKPLMLKLLKALHHVHSNNLIHRDIKPENVMFSQSEVKFIDFGFAVSQKKRIAEMDVAGTPYYIAPEVLSGVYGKECDIWSTGVMLFQMMTGEMPFDGNDEKEVFGKIKKGDFHYPKHSQLSPECVDLIKKMITVPVA